METQIELFNDGNGCTCFMSLKAAGSMGQSDDTGNINRIRIFESMNVDYSRVCTVTQMHTRKVVNVSDYEDRESIVHIEADGMVTASSKIIPVITVADCMPIFLYDSHNMVRALLHSGWQGTGIVKNAISIMKDVYGSKPEELQAVLGPSIGDCCYKVDQNRAEKFSNEWGSSSVVIKSDGPYLSLKNANLKILAEEGISMITDKNYCTCCDERFGSFRREGSDNFNRMIVGSILNPSV